MSTNGGRTLQVMLKLLKALLGFGKTLLTSEMMGILMSFACLYPVSLYVRLLKYQLWY